MLDKISSWWSSSSPKPADKPFDPTDPKQNPLNPEGLKPCCACPQTKRARDDCFLQFDSAEAPEKCKEQVEKHLACMRSLGFKI
ncbi:cytochrome C oxidase copper chaperone-domain-containing protein [Coprinopsis sp. MPI-PUGE-AT-0042]|nr:cytochrome C oxidase copper chaperone-domain-containing protein [Coprinopsis sp. MPI-PUGE-AT-0042]